MLITCFLTVFFILLYAETDTEPCVLSVVRSKQEVYAISVDK